MAKKIRIDTDYLKNVLLELLEIPSPTGYTDQIVHFVGDKLKNLGVPFELTRRGAIRSTLKGDTSSGSRALVSHLDTLGAMVRELKPNGRLGIVMIGHWSARFAEGSRVKIFTDTDVFSGTILPLKASGHTYNNDIDSQAVSWDNLEIRVDEKLSTLQDLVDTGFNVGDFVAIEPNPEFADTGFINSRHLDNKAGVACELAAIKAVINSGQKLHVDCHPLFTIAEEEGTGASSVLHGHVASMVAIDNSTIAPGQNSSEYGVTIAMRDLGGIYDYHLSHRLIKICREKNIRHKRDVFRYYRSDATAALEAGNDIRAALVCFGLDASHGYERTHISSLESLASLLANYIVSEPEIEHDRYQLGPLESFTRQVEESDKE